MFRVLNSWLLWDVLFVVAPLFNVCLMFILLHQNSDLTKEYRILKDESSQQQSEIRNLRSSLELVQGTAEARSILKQRLREECCDFVKTIELELENSDLDCKQKTKLNGLFEAFWFERLADDF